MRRVDDVFKIHKEGRTGGNGRRYVLHAVRQMIQSPATQEGLKLGELEGYYGHGRRHDPEQHEEGRAAISVLRLDGRHQESRTQR